jgi:AcrR family transcriptional regulator
MNAKPGLREQKKARYRADLQAAALQLCSERGYVAVSTKEIADRANLSESPLFRTFKTKAAVVGDDFFLERFVRIVLASEDGPTVDEALHRAIDLTGESITPAEWALEPVRRGFVTGIPELFSASYMGLEYAAQDLRAWARPRTDPGIHSRSIHMYFAYVLSGFAIAQLNETTTIAEWLHELHISVDLVHSGIQLDKPFPHTDNHLHLGD